MNVMSSHLGFLISDFYHTKEKKQAWKSFSNYDLANKIAKVSELPKIVKFYRNCQILQNLTKLTNWSNKPKLTNIHEIIN